MRTAEELRQIWKASQPQRADWDKTLRSKAFETVATLVIAEASEACERFPANASDAILARGLAFQKGVQFAIQRMRGLTQPEDVRTPEPEPYAHIGADYFNKKNLES